MLKALSRGCKQHTIVPKYQAVDPTPSSSNKFIYTAVVTYQIQIDYGEVWRQYTASSYSPPNNHSILMIFCMIASFFWHAWYFSMDENSEQRSFVQEKLSTWLTLAGKQKKSPKEDISMMKRMKITPYLPVTTITRRLALLSWSCSPTVFTTNQYCAPLCKEAISVCVADTLSTDILSTSCIPNSIRYALAPVTSRTVRCFYSKKRAIVFKALSFMQTLSKHHRLQESFFEMFAATTL